jgi:D-alanyl-D-alanine carboxypeptidase-like protein
MGTRALDDLSSEFRPKAVEVLARLTERGYHVLIVQTLRTMAEHRVNLANGTSRAARSKHLARSLRGYGPGPDFEKCDAIDLCPYEVWSANGPDKLSWNPDDPGFKAIGELGEAVGLIWGGRWHDPHDPGHLELRLSTPAAPGEPGLVA